MKTGSRIQGSTFILGFIRVLRLLDFDLSNNMERNMEFDSDFYVIE